MRNEVVDLFIEMRDLIWNKLKEIWSFIAKILNDSQTALSESGQDISSWGDLIWEIINNVFKIFQNLVSGVRALFRGDFQTAFDYLKLAWLRTADTILDMISTIMNAFPDMVNGIIKSINKLIPEINKVRKFFHMEPMELLEPFKNIDISKNLGIENKIKKIEKEIKERTGESSAKAIQEIERVSKKFSGFTSHAISGLIDMTTSTSNNSKKQAKIYKKTISSETGDEKRFHTLVSDWDKKLLEQRLSGLKEWSSKYHKAIKEQIELERQSALSKADNAEDIDKINKYYNNAQDLENKRFFKAQLKRIVDFGKKALEVFKAVANSIKTIFSGFMKLVDLDFDAQLDSLLETGDKVLSFFVDTMPQLSSKVGALANGFFQTIMGIVDYVSNHADEIAEMLMETINVIVDAVVNFIENGGLEKLVKATVTLLIGIIDAIANNLDKIVDAILKALPIIIEGIKQLVIAIANNLDKIIPALIKLVVGVVEAVADLLTDDEFLDALIDAIGTMIEVLIPEILKNLPKIITALIRRFHKHYFLERIYNRVGKGFVISS